MPEGARIYNLFPLLCGTTEEWESHVDRIAGMGFNWIFLNPFHQPGASGSLYAVKDYYSLAPLFRGKSRKSADRLIAAFVAAAGKRGLSVMMDLVVNHTGCDAVLTETHPEWFQREPDGRLAAPFAIDPGDTSKKTVWEDLAELDYSDRPERQEIIGYFSDVVRHYLKLGFKGFRCDAAYKVPKDVWSSLIDAGRKAQPDVLFVAENLGALQEQVEAMRGGGFDYLFNSAKWWDFHQPWLLDQYEVFRSIAPSVAFPETHDTARLAADLAANGINGARDIERRYRQAYLFAAVFSTGVMIPIGFEYGFRRRLHVVKTRPTDWEAPAFDLTEYIGKVNRMKALVPVLNEEGPQRVIHLNDGRTVCLIRRGVAAPGWTCTVINSDFGATVTARLDGLDGDMGAGRELTPDRTAEAFAPGQEISLAPGEVRVFASM